LNAPLAMFPDAIGDLPQTSMLSPDTDAQGKSLLLACRQSDPKMQESRFTGFKFVDRSTSQLKPLSG
jgi:hypothetical protein